MTERSVYEVGQVNNYIKNMFRQDFFLKDLSVKGEISNCKYHTSGHIYFTLKDERGTLNCVMWSSYVPLLTMRLRDGMQVVVTGSVEIYERDGKYQLYAKHVEADGRGALYEQFERLKTQLGEMGMFDDCYKQPIPRFVKTLGVVTAPTGAAIRDIINVSKRRNPFIQIVIYPALVQGEGACSSIVKGIKALEKFGVDCMIVGRGGGSIEDLWAFNEQEVAQAIFDCSVPVISAVGHETDFTIADFVADKRASTPSAGAELAVMEVTSILSQLNQYRDSLYRSLKVRIDRERKSLELLSGKLLFLSPESKIHRLREDLVRFYDRMDHGMTRKITDRQHKLALFCERLKGLSPLEKISSGYAFVEKSDGARLKSVEEAPVGSEICVNLSDGYLTAEVRSVQKQDRS